MKNFTLLCTAVLLFASTTLFSQRISDLTIEGQTALTPFGSFNPKNNGGRTGIGEIIYKNTVDLSNVNVTLNVGSAANITAPDPWPTNWTSTISGVRVSSTENSDWADYNITIKKINPSPLPLTIKTGSDGNFNSSDWTPTTVGWAGAAIDDNKNVIRFGSADRSFVVAFNEAPDKIKFIMKALGDWNANVENIFDVEESADGVNWTPVIQYNKTELMPPASPPVEREFQLSQDTRFVRWVYTKRDKASNGAFNVLLEDISITKSDSNSIEEIEKSRIGAKLLGNNILFDDIETVNSVALYTLSGRVIYENNNPEKNIYVPVLTQGVYLLKMKLKDGLTITEKLVKN